jgi:PilZ domain
LTEGASSGGESWPPAGTHVVVHDHGRRLTAEVTGVGEISLDVTLDARQRPAGPDKRVTLEFVMDDRAYRLGGELDDGTFGSCRFTPTSRAVLLQRRAHMRSSVEVVIVLSSDDGAIRYLGRTHNISVGGALGEFREQPSVGQRLGFSLVPRIGTGVIKGRCRVTRVEDGERVAVAFEELADHELADLAEFILRHR